jgi:SPW repeat
MDTQITSIHFASGVNLLAGIWLLFAAFVFGGSPTSAWNDVLIGIPVIILATWHIMRPEIHAASWANVVLGLWLLVAPATLHYGVPAHLWNDVTVGLILMGFGTWAATTRTTSSPMHTSHAR